MRSDKKVFWKAASDCIIDDFYLKSIPKAEELNTSSFLTPEDILLVLDVDSSLKYMSDGRYAQSAKYIISSHLDDNFPTKEENRDLESVYQNSLNYFGKDINEYPGIILCHYTFTKRLDKKAFVSTFTSKDFATIYDLELYMKVYNENNLDNVKSQYEVINESYLNNPDHPEKKHKLLIGFLFFTLWDISKKSLREEYYCNSETLINSEEYKENIAIKQNECLKMFYNSTDNYFDAETLNTLMSKFIEVYLTSCEIKLNKNIFNFKLSDNNFLLELVYNFTSYLEGNTNQLLKQMTSISDLQKRYLPTLFNTKEKYSSQSEANDVLNTVVENRKLLKEIDCGFNMVIAQEPLPCMPYYMYRDVSVKFFMDSDRKFEENSLYGKYNTKIKIGKEKFRITNSNNLNNYYIYASERNTNYHSSEHQSIQKILDDNYSDNLLYILYDIDKYFEPFYSELSNNVDMSTKLSIIFLKEKLDDIFIDICKKMYPNKRKYNWKDLFDEKGCLLIQVDDYNELTYSNDYDFISKVKTFLDFAFYQNDEWLDNIGTQISIYTLYLALSLNKIKNN